MAEAPENSVHPLDRAGWRAWLELNHERGEGVWLITYKKAAGKPDATLVLKADKSVPYGHVVRAMDISRQSGIRRIVSLTETPRPGG